MNTIISKKSEINDLTIDEQKTIDGGLLLGLATSAVSWGIIAAAGSAIYASFKRGVKEACGC